MISFQEETRYTGKEKEMKIKITETITEIEATAQEISASQTLAGRLSTLLANVLTPYTAYKGDEEEEEEGGNNDD